MKDKKIMLNHSYKFECDENSIVILKGKKNYCIHPVHAMLLAFFNGKNTLKQNIDSISELFSISEEKAYKLITPFINNSSRLIVSYGGCNYVFPESVLIFANDDNIRNDLSISLFNVNETFSTYRKSDVKFEASDDFRIEQISLEDLSVSLTHAGHANLLAAKESVFTGCFYKNTIVGHAVVVSDLHTEAYILISLFVLPMFRGLGIGSKLLNNVLNQQSEDNQTDFLIRLSSKRHNLKLAKIFASKNCLQMKSFGIISLVVNAHKWINKMIDYIGDNSSFYKYKLFDELSDDEIKYIKEYSEANLQPFLQPFRRLNEEIKKYSIFSFDNKSNLEGWTIASYNYNNNELHIYSTYAMPDTRISGSGMRTWNCLRHHMNVLGLGDKVNNISLDVAEDNIRAYKLFKIMAEGISTEEIQYHKLFFKNNI